MSEWGGRQWQGVHVQTLTKRYVHSESAIAMSLYPIRYVLYMYAKMFSGA